MKNMFKNLLLICAIPFVFFWASVGLGFLFYPNDVDSAAKLLTISTGIGCLLALFFVVGNLQEIYCHFRNK
jgi:hypothetical protein